MYQRGCVVPCVVAVLSAAGAAEAFEFRCRFVQRIGNTDVVIPGNYYSGSGTALLNIRLQIGVFDDASGPAPAGGLLGWNVGTLSVSGPVNNTVDRRTPGRLAPFNFAAGPNSNGNPPLPGGDPFTDLTEIDATLGTQSPVWVCDAQGVAPPQPAATVRGRNTYVSIFAFSTQATATSTPYTITAGGNLLAATQWLPVGTPQAPDCGDPLDPSDDIAGSVTYAPVPLAPRGFTCVLGIDPGGPAPGAAALFALAGFAASRRRR